ncbi:glucosylceramidase [Robiginitalea sp. SC105]|nr:glucosylceramidase [Robiginitalea sp. SC105]
MALALHSCSETETPPGTAVLYRTTLDQQHLLTPDTLGVNWATAGEAASAGADASAIPLSIDTAQTLQTMDGFGFTLTGGSALNLQRMSDGARAALLQELFGNGPGDIGISYLRLSVGASDLDEYPWSYDDLRAGETDPELARFSLGYDTLYLIPTLKEILEIQPEIALMGSPWSPPAWMKDNRDTRGGSLLPEYYPAYAQYFVKYIQGMAREGIRIDAVTVQNEPLHPGNNPSLYMPAEAQAEFIANHLGPAFQEAGINTKIVIYDHNADKPEYPISILDNPEAAQYIDGSAFHLYGGTIDALSEVHEKHPDKHLYFTEQWIGAPGNFAENFAWHTENLMIGAPNNWAKAVLQWNLAADENQDPHTDRGGCDRCLGGVTLQGDTVTRNPAYYIVAQNSKFIPPGSLRLGSGQVEGINHVAYRTPEGDLVVVVQNPGEASQSLRVTNGAVQLAFDLAPGEVGTLVYRK